MGLYNRPGRGRKATFNQEQIKQIKEWASSHPQQLKQVRQKIQEQSNMILSQLNEWRERNIEIFVLPSYSPYAERYPLGQLNLIEILWRFMKYRWIEIDSYKNWQSLVNSIETMLREFGEKYVINFV